MILPATNYDLGGFAVRLLVLNPTGRQSDLATAPVLLSGSSAPSTTDYPPGSLYLRKNGSLYQYDGSAWLQLAASSGGTSDEDLSSQCNGSRTNFTLSQSPVSGSVRLYWNGQRLIRNVHFTVSGSTISVVGFTPAAGHGLEAEYLPA